MGGEAEHEVSALGTGNTTLSAIRTNDFRIGFLGAEQRTDASGADASELCRNERPSGNSSYQRFKNVKMWISDITELDTLSKEYASGMPLILMFSWMRRTPKKFSCPRWKSWN